jgi:thiol-disulfide isomerase/thioredoxin
MIVDLTPDNFFDYVKREGPLHVVMHYGERCGPCKNTMPHYERVEAHFIDFNVTNIKFYKFHQWQQEYKEFIEQNNLQTKGVPTFRYFYMGEVINEEAKSFTAPDDLKKHIMDTVAGIEKSMNMEFNLYEG